MKKFLWIVVVLLFIGFCVAINIIAEVIALFIGITGGAALLLILAVIALIVIVVAFSYK